MKAALPASGVLLSILAAVAVAADDSAVSPPYIEAGDCWSYRADHVYYNGPIKDYELCVTYVDRKKGVALAVAKLKEGGREIDLSYSLDWGETTSLSGIIHTEGARFYRFPLRVGDKYSFESGFRRALAGKNVGKESWNMAVVGWEDVDVPAGKFRALRIDGVGTIQRLDTQVTYKVSTAIWYSPAVHRAVKSRTETPYDHWSEELIGYKLNP